MAKPIAASAAATVSVNIANICPEISFRNTEKDIKLIFTYKSINSIDIKIIITFFLLRKIPSTPIVKMIEARNR